MFIGKNVVICVIVMEDVDVKVVELCVLIEEVKLGWIMIEVGFVEFVYCLLFKGDEVLLFEIMVEVYCNIDVVDMIVCLCLGFWYVICEFVCVVNFNLLLGDFDGVEEMLFVFMFGFGYWILFRLRLFEEDIVWMSGWMILGVFNVL